MGLSSAIRACPPAARCRNSLRVRPFTSAAPDAAGTDDYSISAVPRSATPHQNWAAVLTFIIERVRRLGLLIEVASDV
jgi:hypothetical protein